MMDSYEVDFLVIGAHPDDYEIGCGGTLIKLIRKGYSVAGVVITDGSAGAQGTVEERRAEAEKAASILKLRHFEWLDLEDGTLTSREDLPFILADLIRKYRPTTIISHYFEDRHPDHTSIGESLEKSIFLAMTRSRKFLGKPHVCRNVLGFVIDPLHVPKSRIVVDISDTFDAKMQLLKAYRSQSEVVQFVPAANQIFGALFQVKAAELFYPYTIILKELPW